LDFKVLAAAAEQLKTAFRNVTEELTATDQEEYATSATVLSRSLGKPDALPARLKSFARDAGERLESMDSSVSQCRNELLELCRFFELPSPKVVASCEEFAAEIFDNLCTYPNEWRTSTTHFVFPLLLALFTIFTVVGQDFHSWEQVNFEKL
jgi:hypothetical protein